MRVTFAPKGFLQIDEARIIYRNFEGRADKFNHEGERNFALIIPDSSTADRLKDEGWNVRIKPPRTEDESPFMYLPVKVKFNENGPHIYLKTGNVKNKLDEKSVECLDRIRIASVDLDIRPYDWGINGKEGRTAYLQSMLVYQEVTDRFADEEYPEE